MTSLKAKILTSFILLFVLLFLPDKAASQRPRRRVTGSDAAQKDSLPRTPTAKSDTLRIDSVTPFSKKQPLEAPLSTNLPTLWSLLSGGPLHCMEAER